jgi:hypothetical protein
MELDEVVHSVETPDQFADYVMDELGRWAADKCPISFKNRRFRTNMFPFLENNIRSPIQVKFSKNGYVIIKVSPTDEFNDCKVVRFNVADPKLRDNLSACLANLKNQSFVDFISIVEAQKSWRR